MIIGELAILTMINCFIIDLSGFITNLKRLIWKIFSKSPYQDFPFKPFDCTLCMTFWTGLFYLLIRDNFSIENIGIICLFSFLSSTISSTLSMIKEYLNYLINKIIPKF